MRVGLVTPRARAVDGWGRYATAVGLALREFAIEPVFVTAEDAVEPELLDVECHAVLPPLFTRRFETPRSLLAVPRVRRALSSCAVVHGIAEPYLPLLALACRSDQAYVQTAHGTWAVLPFACAVQRPIYRRSLKRVDLLISQSQYTCNAMATHVRLPRHIVLPGGVRTQDFTARSTTPLPGWTRHGPLALSVGHVKKRKGVHVSLEAVALARRHQPSLQLVVVGPVDDRSSYRARLMEQADALGMRDAFHIVGEVTFAALVAWYQAADVFMLLPVHDRGTFEGLGLVYLEAAAAGLPAIGTSGCGAEEAIVDGTTGLVVPPNDARAAAAALCRLLEDGALRQRMAAAARTRASGMSWTRLAESLAMYYRDLSHRRAGV